MLKKKEVIIYFMKELKILLKILNQIFFTLISCLVLLNRHSSDSFNFKYNVPSFLIPKSIFILLRVLKLSEFLI